MGHFIQADSIIPEAVQGVQAWDRYAYTNNNPFRYNDPTGHCIGPLLLVCVGVALIGAAASVAAINTGIDQVEWASSQSVTIAQEQAAAQQWQDNCIGQCHYSHFVDPNPGVIAGGPRPETPVSDTLALGYYNIAQGTVGLVGSVAGLANVGRGALSSLSAQAPDGKGVTVLGRYKAYIDVADDVGGNVFNVPSEVWNKMSSAEQWALNQQFLDDAIARGDSFYLASKWSDAPVGSFYRRELEYLFSKGYTLSPYQNHLIPPDPNP